MSPTALTLRHLRRQGWTVDVCERWIEKHGIRRDLFHAFDLIAFKVKEGIMGVQTTSASNLSSRLTKLRSLPEVDAWLQTGGRAQVWGWRKVNDKWHARIVELLPGDTVAPIQEPPRKHPKPRLEPADLFAPCTE